MTKLVFFADNDTTSDAKDVNAAMVKENADAYVFVGDGPYSTSGTKWVTQQKVHFDNKKEKQLWSRGNHDTKASESWQTQDDMEAWFPECKSNPPVGERTWLKAKQVGNCYIISMDTEDLDVEFKRDQFNWVTEELSKAKALRTSGQIDWIICLAHKPFFTLKSSHSPYTAVRFLYKDLFRDAQVDFMVHGHNHNTQLWLPMIPNQSEANGEGTQLFTRLPDGTFDFTKDHGAAFIVTGHAGHEWNPINDSGGGVNNVMHYRDSGKFGYTLIEINGKKATVFSKDTDNQTIFEYKVTREGGIVEPPEECTDPTKCKDPQTGECRLIGANEHKSPTDGSCQKNPPTENCPDGQCKDPITQQCRPPGINETIGADGFCKIIPPPQPPGEIICPRDYHYEQNLKRCIPDLEPQLPPVCPAGTKWNGKVCVPTGTGPEPCPDNQCRDVTTGQCRVIGANEVKDTNGFCKQKPPPPTGEAVAVLTVPDKVEPGSTGNKSSAEGSIFDTIEHTVTSTENIIVRDVSQLVKEFDVPPDKENFSISSNLKVTKGGSIKQISKQTTVQRSTSPPGGKVLYDSNIDGKWNNGQKRVVTEGEGNQDPDGKGLHAAASGNPTLTIDGDGISHLESSRWGRIYIYAKNYNFKLEGFFKFETDHGEADNISIKLRSRHGNNNHPQGGGSNEFGGIGFAFHPSGEVEIAAEIVHSGGSFDFGNLQGPKLGLNEWHKYTISGFDEGGGITVTVAIDDKSIGSKKWSNPHSTALEKDAFAADSYFWIRLNCHDGDRAKAAIKDLKLYDVT